MKNVDVKISFSRKTNERTSCNNNKYDELQEILSGTGGVNMISRFATLYHLNFQFSLKKIKTYKETGMYVLYKGRETLSIHNVPKVA